MMKFLSPLLLVIAGVLCEDKSSPGVVYLIGSLDDPIPSEAKKREINLFNPIADNEALADGVYFKPEDGKPLKNPNVS